MKHMKQDVKAAVIASLFGILIMAAAYWQRGCWAVGAEFLLPLILLIVLLKEKEGGNDNETNQSDHGFKSDDA